MLVRPLHRMERTGELTEAATVALAMDGRAVVADMTDVATVVVAMVVVAVASEAASEVEPAAAETNRTEAM